MKQVLYACRNSKNAVRGLNFLLSNENIELRGCLIPDRCENVREICEKNDINIYDDKTRDKINEDFEESSIDLLISFSDLIFNPHQISPILRSSNISMF